MKEFFNNKITTLATVESGLKIITFMLNYPFIELLLITYIERKMLTDQSVQWTTRQQAIQVENSIIDQIPSNKLYWNW